MTNSIHPSYDIATTIQQQLYAAGTMKVWSWGAHQFYVIDNGLQFTVQARRFKGQIRIIYDEQQDLYIISFGKLIKEQWQEKKRFEDVYFDMMTDLIDEEIEKAIQ